MILNIEIVPYEVYRNRQTTDAAAWPPGETNSLGVIAALPAGAADEFLGFTSPEADLFRLTGPGGDPARLAAEAVIERLLHQAARRQGGASGLCRAVLITAAGRLPANIGYEDALHHLRQSVEALAIGADVLGVELWLETPAADLLLSPLEMRELIDTINNARCYVCVNTAHVSRFSRVEDWLAVLGRRVAALR